MIDLRDARTPSLRETPTSHLLEAFIEAEMMLAGSFDREGMTRLEVRQQRDSIAAEIDRRIPAEKP